MVSRIPFQLVYFVVFAGVLHALPSIANAQQEFRVDDTQVTTNHNESFYYEIWVNQNMQTQVVTGKIQYNFDHQGGPPMYLDYWKVGLTYYPGSQIEGMGIFVYSRIGTDPATDTFVTSVEGQLQP